VRYQWCRRIVEAIQDPQLTRNHVSVVGAERYFATANMFKTAPTARGKTGQGLLVAAAATAGIDLGKTAASKRAFRTARQPGEEERHHDGRRRDTKTTVIDPSP